MFCGQTASRRQKTNLPLSGGFVLVLLCACGEPVASGAAGAEVSDIPQVQMINAAMEQQWRESGLVPSPVEDDLKWSRRVYLDLIGRIPTYEELTEFVRDKDHRKREKLVDRLLGDPRYTEEFAEHWGTL